MLPFYAMDDPLKYNYVSTIILNNNFTKEYHYILLIMIICQIHTWIYILFCRNLIKQIETRFKQVSSSVNGPNLLWVKLFINTIIVVYLCLIGLYIMTLRTGKFQSYDFLGIVIAVALFFLGYYGMIQPERSENKPEKQSLADTEIRRCFECLNHLMEEEKVFRNPDLTLPNLAKMLSISRCMLSKIINDYYKMNFYDYINKYPIEEVKKLLLDPERSYITIMAIAAEAGFKSKASFNRAFKKFTLMTPSQYKNENIE